VNYEQAVNFGVDLIFPAVLLFTIGYALLPFWRSTLGWAMMLHGTSTLLLLGPSLLQQLGWIPAEYPGSRTLTLTIVILWIFAWWLLAWAIIKPRLGDLRAWWRARAATARHRQTVYDDNMNSSFKYEPVALAAALSALSTFLVAFGFDFLSADQATLVAGAVSAVTGAVAAFKTTETPFVLIASAVKAVAVVAISYGLNLSQEQLGALVVAIETLGGVFYVRSQVSPAVN
jgi:hypothetical protein